MIVTTGIGEFSTSRVHGDDDQVVVRARTVAELARLRETLNHVLGLPRGQLVTEYPILRWAVGSRPGMEMTRDAWALTLGVLAEQIEGVEDRPQRLAAIVQHPASGIDPRVVAELIEPPR